MVVGTHVFSASWVMIGVFCVWDVGRLEDDCHCRVGCLGIYMFQDTLGGWGGYSTAEGSFGRN